MAEFVNCPKGDFDEKTFYGYKTKNPKGEMLRALKKIEKCPKHASGKCSRMLCEPLRKNGKLEKTIKKVESVETNTADTVDKCIR